MLPFSTWTSPAYERSFVYRAWPDWLGGGNTQAWSRYDGQAMEQRFQWQPEPSVSQ